MSMSNLVFFECNLFVVGIEMCRNATDARAGVGENGSNTRKSSTSLDGVSVVFEHRVLSCGYDNAASDVGFNNLVDDIE